MKAIGCFVMSVIGWFGAWASAYSIMTGRGSWGLWDWPALAICLYSGIWWGRIATARAFR